MNSRRVTKTLACAVLCTVPVLLHANGMRLVSHDGFATARGEAFVATADNPSAVYYNPAGITQIEGDELRAGIYSLYLDPTFTPPDTSANAGETYRLNKHFAFVPQTFFTHSPRDSKWTFGAGLYAPYGAGISWPQDTGFRAVATKGRLSYLRLNPVAAFELTPTLSLAVGVMGDYGNINLEQGLRPREQPFANSFRFQGEGWTVGYNAGVLWQPHDKLSFGATFRSQTTVDFDGKTEMEQQPIIRPTRLNASMEMEFPLTAVVGVSYRPSTNWNIEFDADYTDWSCVGKLTIKQEGTPPFPVQPNIPVNLYWKESWMFSAGVTRYLNHGWHVSAGYMFNQNSVPDDYYQPLVADLDRHFFTMGVGRTGRKYDFDVTYQFGYGPDHTVTGSLPPSQPGFAAGQNGNGTYDFISHAIFVSFGVHF